MAIILVTGRPAWPVDSDGTFGLDGAWAIEFEPHYERLARATRSVARLTAAGTSVPWLGTAFVCGPGLALASSFAVEMALTGRQVGEQLRIAEGVQLRLEFNDGRSVGVRDVAFVHPYFSVALLRLEVGPSVPAPLPLTAAPPDALGGKAVALISYVRDPRSDQAVADRIWQGAYDRVCIHPGRITQIGTASDERGDLPALYHDCSSIAGAGGGPLIDPTSGEVLGVHMGGVHLDHNQAMIMWELARDPVVWRYSVSFRPNPRPSWLERWPTLQPGKQADEPTDPPSNQGVDIESGVPDREVRPLVALPRSSGWTVDVVPIDFTSPVFKMLLHALQTTVPDIEEALNLATDAGVTRGSVDGVGAPQVVWRRILERASTKGVLRPLIENLCASDEYAGLRGVLAAALGRSEPGE